jgi:endonuclease-3
MARNRKPETAARGRRTAQDKSAARVTPKPSPKRTSASRGGSKGKVRGQTSKPPGRPRGAAALAAYAERVWNELLALYPDAHCELDFRSPWELLVATILSAQCTDKRVNMVTPVLFTKYPGPRELSAARPEDVEAIVKSTGFFRAKTKALLGVANALVERHGAQVPSTMPELVVLPGVGRKTANVVLGNAFGINEGVVVDTHVGRLSVRLGFTRETDPVKVEQVLMGLFPRERWSLLSHLLIWHGRRICEARRPRCEICPLNEICPSSLARSSMR